jgi:hypothetical protein
MHASGGKRDRPRVQVRCQTMGIEGHATQPNDLGRWGTLAQPTAGIEPPFDCREPGSPREGTGPRERLPLYATNGMSDVDLLPSESTAIT